MRLLHMADIHLGAEPDKGQPWGEGRGEHIWEAFSQALDAAAAHRVDLILIAGDLFHRQPLKRELKEVNYLFSRLGGIPVVLMAGNHDYISRNSTYHDFTWNDNVFFFRREQAEVIEFPELNAAVYGLSYEHREIQEPLYREFTKSSRCGIHILLGHGGDAQHIPIQPAELERTGFDYVALGHIHKPGRLRGNRMVMAGALQPLDYNDPGPHGYWTADLSRGNAEVSFHSVPGCGYVHLTVEVRPEMTHRELEDQILAELGEAGEQTVCKLILQGRFDPDMEPDLARLKSLGHVAAVELNCQPAYDYEKLKREFKQQVTGRFIEAMEALPQDSITKQALYFGVDALMGR